MPHRTIFVVVISCVVAISSPEAAAQEHDHGQKNLLPVAADGSKNPELISDALAYRHFIMAVAESDHPSQEGVLKRTAILAPIRLPAADADALVRALAGVKDALNEITEQRRSILPQEVAARSADLSNLKVREDDVLHRAAQRLRAALSAGGAEALDRHVREHVKSRIVIYGAIPPANLR